MADQQMPRRHQKRTPPHRRRHRGIPKVVGLKVNAKIHECKFVSPEKVQHIHDDVLLDTQPSSRYTLRTHYHANARAHTDVHIIHPQTDAHV
jgi:hypothetical protein